MEATPAARILGRGRARRSAAAAAAIRGAPEPPSCCFKAAALAWPARSRSISLVPVSHLFRTDPATARRDADAPAHRLVRHGRNPDLRRLWRWGRILHR